MSPNRRRQNRSPESARTNQRLSQPNAAKVRPSTLSPGPASDEAPPSTLSATPQWYVDVAAVRIQSWLGRTADLRTRRGASAALAALTDPDQISDSVGQPNPSAGAISGVVSRMLALPESGINDDAEALAAAARVSVDVAKGVWGHLPGVGIQASVGRGKSYLEAYSGMSARAREQGRLLDVPALPLDFPLAKPCDVCRSSAAVDGCTVKEGKNERSACRDCATRADYAGRLRSPREPLPVSQQTLLNLLQVVTGDSTMRLAQDFREVALGNVQVEGDARTQIATVFADGNAVGALMKGLATRRSVGKWAAVTLLDRATKAAICDAANATLATAGEAQDPSLPIIAHIAGGDDVLVTVPASAAWAYVMELEAAFATRVKERVTLQEPPESGAGTLSLHDLLGGAPSLSCGVVFHHASHPIADVIEHAEALLKSAKRQWKSVPAVAFLDLTAHGQPTSAQAGRSMVQERCLSLQELMASGPRLAALAGVSASQRATLHQLIRELEQPATTPAAPGREDPLGALERRLNTMRLEPVLESIAGPDATREQVAERLRDGTSRPTAVAALRRDLELSRWWAPSPEPTDQDRGER